MTSTVCSGTHHRESAIWFPLRRPSGPARIAEPCSAARVRFAASYAAPLPPALRSAHPFIATGGSAGNQIINGFFVLPKTRTRL